MEVAKCPKCDHELELADITTPHARLGLAVSGLLSASAVMDMLLQLPEYESAREGFDERMEEITERVHETTDSMTEWGTAFDGEDET